MDHAVSAAPLGCPTAWRRPSRACRASCLLLLQHFGLVGQPIRLLLLLRDELLSLPRQLCLIRQLCIQLRLLLLHLRRLGWSARGGTRRQHGQEGARQRE